jgi:hypothetical protein
MTNPLLGGTLVPHHTAHLRPVLTTLLIALAYLTGCEDITTVGSGCPDGVCPLSRSSSQDRCILRGVGEIVQITGAPSLSTLCLATELTRDSRGVVPVHLYFSLPSGSATSQRCADFAFLRGLSGAAATVATNNYPGRETCEVVQLAVTQQDGGQSVAAGEGFYYDDFSEQSHTQCPLKHGLHFTSAARPWDGVNVHWDAALVYDSHGAAQTGLTCEAHPGSVALGTGCLPELASYEPSESEVVLETHSAECGDGVCMVYHLAAGTAASCSHTGELASCAPGDLACRATALCVDRTELSKRAYCTCRCDAPQGAPDTCACPSGYRCEAAGVSFGYGAVDGSYCVKNGTFTQ